MSKNKLALSGEAEIAGLVHLTGGEARTTSLLVAEKFGKRHDHVLRDIETLIKGCPEEFNRPNFGLVDYIDAKGEARKMYELTRDGFSLLVMGFTGKKAMEWKLKYIAAFNRMEQELIRRTIQQQNADWQQKRLEGKVARRDLTDAIAALEEYILARNPGHRKPYYYHYTVGTYEALYVLEGKRLAKNFRDLLDRIQLGHLETAENIITKTIWDEMDKGTEYHKIYQIAKGKIEWFAEAVGKSVPGQSRKALRA